MGYVQYIRIFRVETVLDGTIFYLEHKEIMQIPIRLLEKYNQSKIPNKYLKILSDNRSLYNVRIFKKNVSSMIIIGESSVGKYCYYVSIPLVINGT